MRDDIEQVYNPKNFMTEFTMQRKVNIIFTLVCGIALLTSCSYNPFIGNNRTTGSPVGAAIGAGAGAGSVALLGGPKSLMALTGLGGGMLGYYLTTERHDAGGIIQAGGQVYSVGEFVGIYIPTDKLFEPNTYDFLPQAETILSSAAAVLTRYPNNNIIISGNTSGFYRARWEQRISEKRAQRVAAYLWGAGINNFMDPSNNTRHLRYVGYGDYFPIANNITNKGIRANSRIQIVSYPTTCHLQMDQRSVSMNNVGAIDNDDAINKAPRCCPSDDPC